MLSTTKALLNNLNQITFRKNVNKLEIRPDKEVKEKETKNMIYENKYSVDELVNLETTIREKNLKVFASSYTRILKSRFFVVTLPALLSATTIGLLCAPGRYDTTKEVDVYKGEHTLYNSELGVSKYEDKYHIISNDEESSFTYLSDKNEGDIQSIKYVKNNSVTFKMYDELKSILAKFSLSDDGELIINEINTGDIVDFTDYSEYSFSNLDDDYDILVNRIINILSNSERLTEDQQMILKSLCESDMKLITIEVDKYTKKEKEELLVSKTLLLWRLVFFVVTAIYIGIEIDVLRQTEYARLKVKIPKVINNSGELIYGEDEEVSLIFGPLSLREEFIAAEKDRILKVKEELYTNTLATVDNSPILTGYEKKLKRSEKIER
ncbi:MAG: hypothetical protein J1F35_02615 [Erysipelotrichales bacterium]|nr:hypothetical protein [Erysipelotrichales bacterium]